MLCVSISPKLIPLARVDLLNAGGQADLVELCLDDIQRPVDVRALLAVSTKPVIVSCRRVQDGGHWNGTEAERLALLREAVAAGPAYIELDPDAARQIPRAGNTRRVIAWTSLDAPLDDLSAKIDQAANLSGDVVKFTWPTATLDSAWPLLAQMTRVTALPVIGLGVGAAGRTLALLGCKYGSPWVYAALEQGMETYPGQPTIHELETDYQWPSITAETRLHGVAGFGHARQLTLRLLNAGCHAEKLDTRFVPLEIGDFTQLRRRLDLLRFGGVIAGGTLGARLASLFTSTPASAEAPDFPVAAADLLLRRDDGWHAHNLLWRATGKILGATLRRQLGSRSEVSLAGRSVLLLGSGPVAQALLHGFQEAQCSVAIADGGTPEEIHFCDECGHELAPEASAAQILARQYGVRYVPLENLSETRPEILVVAIPALELGHGPGELNPAWLRPPLVVIDVTRLPEETDVLSEARQRGCTVVRPSYVFAEQLAARFRLLTGQPLPAAVFHEAVDLTSA